MLHTGRLTKEEGKKPLSADLPLLWPQEWIVLHVNIPNEVCIPSQCYWDSAKWRRFHEIFIEVLRYSMPK